MSFYSKAVCDEKVKGKYDKKKSRMVRSKIQMLDDVADKRNEMFSQTGLFYTKLKKEEKKEKKETKADKK